MVLASTHYHNARWAAEAGAIEAKDVVDALLGRAAAQQLVVGLGCATLTNQQGGDWSYGRKMTFNTSLSRMEMVRHCRD